MWYNSSGSLKQEQYDLLIFDTAGRLHVDEELMDELADVKKIVCPVIKHFYNLIMANIPPNQEKIKLRSILTAHDIQVIDEQDGTLIIYIENQKVATFKKPTYKLRQDLSKLNRKERLYIEMTIECESLFETAQEV